MGSKCLSIRGQCDSIQKWGVDGAVEALQGFYLAPSSLTGLQRTPVYDPSQMQAEGPSANQKLRCAHISLAWSHPW